MILLEFLRRNSSKIYILIFTVVFGILFLLDSFNLYLKKTDNAYFLETSYLYLESSIPLEEELTSDKKLINSTNILKLDYFSSDEPLEEYLVNYELNGIITFRSSDKDMDLNYDEVIVGLDELNFINNKNKHINKTKLTISSNDKNFELTIKDVINSNRIGEIIISDKLFDEIISKSDKYVYLSNITKEKYLKDELERYKEYSSLFLDDSNSSDYSKRSRIKELVKQFEVINIVFLGLFIIITIIINRNLISDMDENIKLEYVLGFNKFQINKNIFIRLLFIHYNSLIISVILSLPIAKIINKCMNFDIQVFRFKYIGIFSIIIILSDLLLSLVVNNKKLK